MALRLTDQDVIAVVRLLADVAGTEGTLQNRRERLLEGLARLIAADARAWIISRGLDQNSGAPLSVVDGGWNDDAEQGRVWYVSTQPDFIAAVMKDLPLDQHTTRVFDADHPGWGEGEMHRKYLVPLRFDHLMFSFYPVTHTVFSVIGLHRRSGRPAYGVREKALAHLVIGEIEMLHRAGLDVPANTEALSSLTPRQSEILLYALAGDSRKQIARKTGLSPHTVGGHLKVLHKHFKVSSRAELLALFVGDRGAE